MKERSYTAISNTLFRLQRPFKFGVWWMMIYWIIIVTNHFFSNSQPSNNLFCFVKIVNFNFMVIEICTDKFFSFSWALYRNRKLSLSIFFLNKIQPRCQYLANPSVKMRHFRKITSIITLVHDSISFMILRLVISRDSVQTLRYVSTVVAFSEHIQRTALVFKLKR